MKSKHLGVLLAALALSLAAASSAPAAEFKAPSSPVTFEGSQSTTNKLTIQGSSMTCTTVTFSSEARSMPTSSVLFTPFYGGCTLFGIASGKVTMNGCRYRFNTSPQSFDLSCPSNKMVLEVMTFLGRCKVEFPGSNLGQNQGLGNVAYVNSPKGNVTLSMSITGITVEVTESTGICPLEKGKVENASYLGDVQLEGNGGATPIEVG